MLINGHSWMPIAGAECSSVPAKKPAPPLAKVAEDHTQPVTVQHEGPESGEEVRATHENENWAAGQAASNQVCCLLTVMLGRTSQHRRGRCA